MKFVLLAFLFSSAGRAAEIPRELSLGSSDFTHRALGSACFAMDASIDGLPCNPAFTAKERRSQFQTHIFFGNNVEYADDAKNLLNEQGDQDTVRRLFNQKRSAEMEANIELGYLREKMGLSVTPYRLSYYSLIRNTSLPVITIYAAQEEIVRGQVASYVSGDFYFGLQVRGVHRKFVASQFTLADAVVEGGREGVMPVQYQRALYFEPGLLWAPEDQPLQPQISLAVTQLGTVDKKYDHLPASPQGHFGASIKPLTEWGVLELGGNVSHKSQYEKWSELVRLASSYRLGITQTSFSFTEDQYDLGLLLSVQALRAGLVYDYKRFENLLGEKDQLHTLYFQLGAEF